MIPLAPEAQGPAERFLAADLPGAMFALANLRGRGRAMRSWVALDNGAVSAFLGLTEDGMLIARAPCDAAPWGRAAGLLAGSTVAGVFGRPAAVLGLLRALGLDDVPCRMSSVEASFTLAVADLAIGELPGLSLAPLGDADRALAIDWRAAYEIEVLGARPDTAHQAAPRVVDTWLRDGSHRLLWREGAPVALTGFNADLGAEVQIGGVYCPPALRGRGYARHAVALHLAEARARGATVAILFTGSQAAERAYRAIGFRPEGEVAMRYFAQNQRVGGCR